MKRFDSLCSPQTSILQRIFLYVIRKAARMSSSMGRLSLILSALQGAASMPHRLSEYADRISHTSVTSSKVSTSGQKHTHFILNVNVKTAVLPLMGKKVQALSC